MTTATHKWVYLFHDGSATQRDLLGGKGANLGELTAAGFPVPPIIAGMRRRERRRAITRSVLPGRRRRGSCAMRNSKR